MNEIATRSSSLTGASRTLPRHVLPLMVRVLLSRLAVCAALGSVGALSAPHRIEAQTVSNQVGTVTSNSAGTLILKTTAGAELTVTVDPAAKVLQLAPGSKNLQSATAAALSEVAVGDRVLATGISVPGSTTLSASRIVVMKSAAIATHNQIEQADWRQHGVSGLVRSVEGSDIALSVAKNTVKVSTSPATVIRRYAAGSVDFSAAQPATIADIHVGDQMSVRGTKNADGSEISAQEVVAGTFVNLSGLIGSVSGPADTLTLKDLATKHEVTVQVTSASDLRNLSPEAAKAFHARTEKATEAGAGSGSAPAPEGDAEAARTRHAGMDLSRMLTRLPAQKLADLKPGQAVMIVASRSGGNGPLTVITLLSGVEPLLSANSSGQNAITLSPWSLGSPDAGGSQ
jgi:hypothetical protein